MGNALHRIEILFVSLLLLIAGAVVALLVLVRPALPSAYVQTTPQPIRTSIAQPTSAPTSAAGAESPLPRPTVAPAATSAPSTLAPTQVASTVAPASVLARTWIVPSILIASWPYLLLSVGVCGLALVIGRRIRRRRLSYTNQSVGQMLAAADPVTRESNVRVMRNLAAQGLLTGELAEAAGIDQPGRRLTFPFPQPRIPRPRLPALRLPTIRIAKLRLPTVQLPRRQPRPLAIDGTPVVPARGPAAQASWLGDRLAAIPTPARDLGVASLGEATAPAVDAEAIRAALAAQVVEVLPIEPPTIIDRYRAENSDTWTAEDRVLALAGMLAEIWRAEELTSPILALDTASAPGNGQVIVTLEQHPNEEERIVALPERISAECPEWRASWRQDKLIVDVVPTIALPLLDGPLIVPLLVHGRGGKTTRFHPLTSWRHLALYGGQALHALHALLCSLLYNQPPSHVALAILDRGEISPLYRAIAHLVPPPDTDAATLDQLTRILRRPVARGDVRPLLLVVIEPDSALLIALTTLLTRLRQQPGTPLHLLLVQERLLPAGHELYAMLPALITSGGRGPVALLPGQGDWPRPGQARLVGHRMRIEGRPLTIDEIDAAAQLAHLRGNAAGLLPVLWDVQAQAMAVTVPDLEPGREGDLFHDEERLAEEDPIDGDEAESDGRTDEAQSEDHDVQQRRIAQAIVAQRQRLIDQDSQVPTRSEMTPLDPSFVAEGPESIDPDMSIVPDSSADTVEPGVSDGAADTSVAALEEQVVAGALLCAQEPLHSDEEAVAQLASIAPTADAVSIGQVREPAIAADLPGPGADDGPKPRSRRAELLRSAIAAGRPDAPALHALLPQRIEPDTSSTGAASSAATGRSPTDHAPEPQPIVEPENGWPIGPAPLGRVAMAELMARVASAPAIIAGQANEQGVTKNRLVELLKGTHKAQAKELAEALMAWFDLAGLLVEPTRPGRLRHPRALTTLNLSEIAEMLNATACPDKDTVRKMWAESNEGRN